MNEEDRQTERPLWVRIGLWGLPNRAAAWGFCCLSIAVAVGCLVYGFVDPRFFAGVLLFLAAWWYYAAIKWVDDYDRWS